MPNDAKTWEDLRRIADEVELKIHLAGMDARDRWHDLKPRLAAALRKLRDDVVRH